jgi:hypothetical protein
MNQELLKTPRTDKLLEEQVYFMIDVRTTNQLAYMLCRKLERELNVCHKALVYISSLNTSQDASLEQCSAVAVAMNALEDKKYLEDEKNLIKK